MPSLCSSLASSTENPASHVWFQGSNDYKPALLSLDEVTEKIGMNLFKEENQESNALAPFDSRADDIYQLIKRPSSNDLEIRWIEGAGYSLFARRDFRSGEPICFANLSPLIQHMPATSWKQLLARLEHLGKQEKLDLVALRYLFEETRIPCEFPILQTPLWSINSIRDYFYPV